MGCRFLPRRRNTESSASAGAGECPSPTLFTSPLSPAPVVYYGVSPPTPSLNSVRAPVLGLYGGSDARVDATIPPADSALRALGRTYEHTIFPGAGHGFLRQQSGMDGAN